MYKDGFSYVLEVGDHDAVHALVGGDMGNQLRAAADPVFFLHHANVDRLWHIWQRNCTDPQRALSDTWRRGKLQLGRDEEVMAGDLLHISSLGYGYDDTRPIAVDRPLVRASNAVLSGPIVESAQRGPVLPGTAFDLRERGLTVSVRGPDPRHFERGGRLRLALRVRRLSSKSVHMGIYAGLTSTGGVPLTPPIGVISSFQAGRRLADDRGMEMAFEVPDEFRSADGSVEISFVPAVLTRSNEPVLRIESLALIRTAAALQPLR
jgi:tyrosinase